MPHALSAARLVHRAGHPSFTEASARTLVAGRATTDLREVWELTGIALGETSSPRAEANLVLLRSVLLDALEAADPQFRTWLWAQAPPGRRRID